MNEVTREWLHSAYRTLQKAWNEQGSDDSGVTVVLTAEELRALEDAITLALYQ